jgi:hypothetical protein
VNETDTQNALTRHTLTSDDRWQQMITHNGVAYIVRAEPDGGFSLWRSRPPQVFDYVGEWPTQPETMDALQHDFEKNGGGAS